VARGGLERARRDARDQAKLERPRMQLARAGIPGLEAVEQLDDRGVVGRGGAGGDERGEERRARDERLVGAARRRLPDEGAERVDGRAAIGRRRLRPERRDTALERAQPGARGEPARADLAVLPGGVRAVTP